MRPMTCRGPYELRVEEEDRPRIEHLHHGLVPGTRIGHASGHELIGVAAEAGVRGRG